MGGANLFQKICKYRLCLLGARGGSLFRVTFPLCGRPATPSLNTTFSCFAKLCTCPAIDPLGPKRLTPVLHSKSKHFPLKTEQINYE